jgi:hypothetical protein
MNKIVSPLRLQMRNRSVADLQDRLLLLMEFGFLLRQREGDRHELAEGLKRERAKSAWSDIEPVKKTAIEVCSVAKEYKFARRFHDAATVKLAHELHAYRGY